MARPARQSPRDSDRPEVTATLHMPHTPPDAPDFPAGRHVLEAQQQAERDIASGAVDVSYVEAGEGPMAAQREIAARAEVRKAGSRQKAQNSHATGVVLLEQARLGERTPPRRGVSVRSRLAAGSARDAAVRVRDDARAAHRASEEVLAGTRTTSTGERRAGSPIAPGTRHLLRAVVLATGLDYALLVLPILVEGAVVADNMHRYFRTDDSAFWIPLTIAAMTVLSLTVVPFLVGRRLGKVIHGAPTAVWQWVLTGLGVVTWLYVGTALAIVRVSVDQEAALDRAQSRYDRQVEVAVANGQDPASIAPVVPGDVFDPTVPVVMWLGILLGIGVALILFEVFVHNPARLEELRERRALQLADDAVTRLDEQIERVDAEIVMQEAANASAAAQWEIELERIDAEVALASAAYDEALIHASGSPELAMAIENRRRPQGSR